jgi:hypothetical protein
MGYESKDKVTRDPGIFLTKGMKVSIPSFSISVSDDGKVSSDPVTLHTGLDMCPYWIGIAYEHLIDTELAHNELMAAKDGKEDAGIGTSLQKEFVSGMQTIMAAGVAIDAYYGSVKRHIEIPKDLTKTWREKGTGRHKQIAEVLRRAFPMSTESGKKLRDILKQNLTFRDRAVHPEYGTTAPQLHVELNKVTDWRYATFRFSNAKTIAGLTLSIIYQTASNPHKKKYPGLKKYCEELIVDLAPLLKKWTDRYGELFDQNSSNESVHRIADKSGSR